MNQLLSASEGRLRTERARPPRNPILFLSLIANFAVAIENAVVAARVFANEIAGSLKTSE